MSLGKIDCRFAIKATASLAIVLGVFLYFGARYRIAIDSQVHKCLPPYSVFLVDRFDHSPERGELYAFLAGHTMEPYFPMGLLVIKRVTGLPGDTVSVGSDVTAVNGKVRGYGLALAGKIGRPVGELVRTLIIPKGWLWVMGDTADSFDSRYWGLLSDTQGQGKAYALY